MEKYSTVLITGASSGIGKDLAQIFALKSYVVILAARSLDKLEALKKEWEHKYEIQVEVIQVDLSTPEGPKKLYDEVISRNLSVDILVNNAGVGRAGHFYKDNLAANTKMIELNVTSLVKLTHMFVKDMVQRRRGTVLNVASTAAFQPGPYMSVYFATKAFVLSFTEALREELQGKNIHIITLCPGSTKTEFFNEKSLQTINIATGGMESKAVAQLAYQGILKNKAIVITGLFNKILVFLGRFIPRRIVRKITARLLKPKMN